MLVAQLTWVISILFFNVSKISASPLEASFKNMFNFTFFSGLQI